MGRPDLPKLFEETAKRAEFLQLKDVAVYVCGSVRRRMCGLCGARTGSSLRLMGKRLLLLPAPCLGLAMWQAECISAGAVTRCDVQYRARVLCGWC